MDQAPTSPDRRARRHAPRFAAVLAFLAIGTGVLLAGCTPGQGAALRAVSQLGKPYVRGGASPSVGFDCSGLTMWSWRMAGKRLPRTAAEQFAATYPVSRSHLRAGDLAFYQVNGRISHVAMYVGHQTLVQARKPGYPVERDALGWWSTNLVGYHRVR